MNSKLYTGDCLEQLNKLDDNSIDLVLIDPPYNVKKAAWDSWKTIGNYVNFMGALFLQCQRVLKPSGSMYFFHNDFLQIAELQHWLYTNTDFKHKSFIIWDKGEFRARGWKNPSKANTLRSWFPTAEYCLYYTFEDDTGLNKVMLDMNNFKALRGYFKILHEFIGLSKATIIREIGGRVDHVFRYDSPQWSICTEDTYNALIDKFKINECKDFREYADLYVEYEATLAEYDALRLEYEAARPVHNLDEYHNNVWRYKTVNTGKFHPCEKPVEILERIIKTSSNEGQVVLDCFMGSGTTGIACMNTNRKFIGIERDEKYFNIAKTRINEACLFSGAQYE